MARPGSARPVRHPVAISLLVITASVLPVFLTGALAVQIRAQLHFAGAGLGVLVAVFFLAGVVGSLAAGQVSDRSGPSAVMRVATATSALCLAGIAVVAHSAVGLGVLLGVAGVANGLVQPSVNAFLVRAVPPGRQGLAFGMRQSAVPLSTLLGGLAVPALALTVGWRWAYGAAAALAVVACLSLPSPAAMGAVLAGRERHGGAASARPATEVHLPPLVVLALGAALGAGAANALGTFLVAAAVSAKASPGVAGWLAAGGSLCGLVTRVSVGARADRRPGGHLRVVVGMLALGGAGYALLATDRLELMVPGAALAFGAGWGWNGLFNYAVARTHPHAPAKATAVTQAGVFAGSVAVPLLFGQVVDHASFGAAWLLAGGFVVAAAGVVAMGGRLLVASADGRPGRATIPVQEVGSGIG